MCNLIFHPCSHLLVIVSITSWKTKVLRRFIVFLSQSDKKQNKTKQNNRNRETEIQGVQGKGERGWVGKGAAFRSVSIQHRNVFAVTLLWVFKLLSAFTETSSRFLGDRDTFRCDFMQHLRDGQDLQLIGLHSSLAFSKDSREGLFLCPKSPREKAGLPTAVT